MKHRCFIKFALLASVFLASLAVSGVQGREDRPAYKQRWQSSCQKARKTVERHIRKTEDFHGGIAGLLEKVSKHESLDSAETLLEGALDDVERFLEALHGYRKTASEACEGILEKTSKSESIRRARKYGERLEGAEARVKSTRPLLERAFQKYDRAVQILRTAADGSRTDYYDFEKEFFERLGE